MIFVDEMKDLKIYKKPLILPVNTDKKKGAATFLLTPNYQSSKNVMNLPYLVNRKYYESYYMERNVNYFIDSSMLTNADIHEDYIEKASEDTVDTLSYLSESKRSDLPDDVFGIPSLRKYPMQDKKHVELAIKFFNHVDKEYEKELADNIIKFAKKYDVEVEPGKRNRLRNYIEIKESLKEDATYDYLMDYLRQMKEAKDGTEVLNEALVFNKDDTVRNFKDWVQGNGKNNNVLLITGLSGSGKTTLGKQLSEENNAEIFSLDWLDFPDDAGTYRYLPRHGLVDYILYKNKVSYLGSRNLNYDDYIGRLYECMNAVIEFANKHPRKKFIVEGIQLIDLVDYKPIERFPIIIKGTSVTTAIYRRIKRSLVPALHYGNNIFLTYAGDDRALKDFKKYHEGFEFNEDEIEREIPVDICDVEYSGYESDVFDLKSVIDKAKIAGALINLNIKDMRRFPTINFIIKDELESCSMSIEEDRIDLDVLSKKVYEELYLDEDNKNSYKDYILYNVYCAVLVYAYPDAAGSDVIYALASYKSGIYDNTPLEELLSKIEKDHSTDELISICKNNEINKLYAYGREYGINVPISNIQEAANNFDIKYFSKHIKYMTRKSKYSINKAKRNVVNNIEANKPSAPSTGSSTKPTNDNPKADDYNNQDANKEAVVESSVLNTLDESAYMKFNNLVMFMEDAQYDSHLRRILFPDRMRQNKEILTKYSQLKSDIPFIKYTFTDLKRYNNRNLFVDLSYYNEVFFKNIDVRLDRGNNLYIDLLSRLLANSKLNQSGYTKYTVFLPVDDWGISKSTRMWLYREDINPVSAIFSLFSTPLKLKEVFKNMDVVFLSKDKYFKMNFSKIDDYNKAKIKFRTLIMKLRSGEVDIDDEDVDTTPDDKESKDVIVNNIVDKLDNAGVKLQQKNLLGGKEKTLTSKDIKDKVDKSLSSNIDSDKEVLDKKKEELLDAIDKAASTADNTEDAIDALEDDRVKRLIADIAAEEEDAVKINATRASRMLKLQNDSMDLKIKNTPIRDLLNARDNDKPLEETTIPVSINQEEWQNLKFMNFDKDYNINEDITKMIYKLGSVSRPLSVMSIDVQDNSTSEDFIDLYTIKLEDYRGKRFTVKLDIPKFKDNSYLLLRGNKKTIQNQFCNMPILKTDEDTCQIITNYNKIFVTRYGGNVAGKSLPIAGRLIKALRKYDEGKSKKTKISWGDCSNISSKYQLPFDYIDLGKALYRVETANYIVYFDQDEIRETYDVDDRQGLPFAFDKTNKVILYYNPEVLMNEAETDIADEKEFIPISTLIRNVICEDDSNIKELFDSATNSTKYTYSRCSIMSSKIPLVVVAAYSEGLTKVLNKARIKYQFKSKLEKEDRDEKYGNIRFNDGYLVYLIDYASSLLLNGLKDCDTMSYSMSDVDTRSTYLDFLDNFGGRIKADGLDNFYDCLIDPITEEILEHYNLPSDYVEILLHANQLLADNKYIKHTDSSSRRIRRQELIAVKTYKALFNEAYASYANQLRHNKNIAVFSVRQSAVIEQFMQDNTSSDLSVINVLNDIETKNAVTYKGENGMNSDRSYSLDKRTFDDSMLNLLGMSTGFAGNVGITRQATVDMNVDGKRGYIKTINGDTDKLSSAKSLTMTEAMNPFGTNRDDPFRTAMTFIQTAKHALRTKEADPLLVSNGADEALPYMCSDIFAYKAKKKGKVTELTDEYIIVEYNDGEKVYINTAGTIEKNSDGGFYVPMRLTASEKLKVGSTVKENDILAYDKFSFSNSVGNTDNIAYNVGTLSKVAIISTDEGFEDSAVITSTLSERMATDIIEPQAITLDANTNVYNLIKPGTHVEEGDTLVIFQDPYDEDDTNALLRTLVDDKEGISELGRRVIKSHITGTVVDVKIYRTVEVSELSESLQKIVNEYEAPIKKLKKKLDSNKIPSSDLPATYALPNSGKLKNCEGVMIEIYLQFNDILAVGDKIVFDRANKGIIKDIIPADLAPYTEFRPNEEISAFANTASINNRMVISPIIIGSLNKLMVELDRSVKDILEIPYDDSKI